VGTLADGRPFLVMKLIKGRTLAALLEEREKPGGDLDRFLTVFEQVCLAVAFAHARGVIHRDLKPENVMVGAFGEVQVMDWGLAKRLTDRERGVPEAADAGGPESFAQTRAGTVLGTLAYMPPEQARGETERLDARSDVFGLGGILCAILTGTPPHAGRDPYALREKIASGDLAETFQRMERSPGPLLVNRLAIRCLAADPAARPAHAGEVASSLRSILGFLQKSLRQSEVQDATHDADEQQKAARRRAGTFMKIGVAGVLFGVLVGGCGLWNASRYEADARYTEVITGGKLRAVSKELFPFVLDALAKDVSSGLFQRGMDRDGRERSMSRVRGAIANLGPEDQARGYLALAAAAAAIPEESSVESYWQLAIKRYEAVAAEGAEIEVGCRAITWEFPEPLRSAVLRQARHKLQIALRAAGVSEDLRRKATEALEAAEAALKGEDGPANGKGPRRTGKRVGPQ
jgi:hypothetical protein